MIPMNVIFHNLGDPKLWPAPADTKFADAGVLVDVAVLDQGMESGLPSVMFQLKLPDGTVVIAQQTARQMMMLARLIEGRYPNLMAEP
jgi:hypothetical protein